MGVETQQYIRKPLYVEAVRVTEQNFDDLVVWCQGEVLTGELGGKTKKYIKVRVHHPTKNPRQTQAYVGDWLLYTEFGGYKVYTNKAFRATFDLVPEDKPELPASDAVIEPLRAASPETVARANEELGHTITEPQAEEPRTVAEAVDEHHTPQGEPHEYVEATPRAIADAVGGHQSIHTDEVRAEEGYPAETTIGGTPREEINVSRPIPEQKPENAAAGKRVLSEEEQRQMGPEAVREALQSGEVILAQDLAA